MHSSVDRRARYELAHLGEAIGDASRAAMLIALMGGTARPASELAQLAGVAPSTATAHLQRLVQAGLLVARAEGRHRYYALSSVEVAHAVEGLAACTVGDLRRPAGAPRDAIALARTCYGHLAGALAVAFWERARTERWVRWTDPSVTLLPTGRDALFRLGLLQRPVKPLAGRVCLDWSERVPHVSGPLGIALCDSLLAEGWLARKREGRALRVTALGTERFRSLGVRVG